MYSKKLFKLCDLNKEYVYHFIYYENEIKRFRNCLSKKQVLEFYGEIKNKKIDNLILYKLDIKYIDFTEAENFLKLLKIFCNNYILYGNWFKGNDTFENNFLYNLCRKIDLDWQFKKVRTIIKEIQQEKWNYNFTIEYIKKY